MGRGRLPYGPVAGQLHVRRTMACLPLTGVLIRIPRPPGLQLLPPETTSRCSRLLVSHPSPDQRGWLSMLLARMNN